MATEEKDETDAKHIISRVTFCGTYSWSNLTSIYHEEN